MGNLSTPNSVQKLQTALHAKAKAEPGYRFYALYDKISREDILAHAYAQCRSNKGAPGVDRQDFEDIEAYGVERWLGELALALRQETYRPDPIRRVFIPKANGKLRPLGISTLRDRVCMTAAMLVRDFSVRVAVRHPERIAALFPALHLDAIQADVNDDRSVAAAVAGVEGVVDAVSLYAESGSQTFFSVHVEAATRVARLAREAGVGRLIHVSGIGADAGSALPYIRSRGKGEEGVREAFPATTLIRPSIMFGLGDAFLIPIARMLRRLPVFPLFGRGQTQLQPAYVEDVADAIARVMQNAQSLMCYELGGPRVYTYSSLLEVIARHLGKKPRLVPMPFGVWHALASVAEMLPERPIARNQVELMQLDNLTSPDAPGFGDLRISSTSLEDTLPSIVGPSGGLPLVPPIP